MKRSGKGSATSTDRECRLVAFSPGSHSGAMAVQVDPSGAAPHIAMTDASGTPTLNGMGGSSVSCYYADGPFTVVASVAGVAPVTFSLNVAATAPLPPLQGARLMILSGDHQSVPRTGLSVPGGIANFAPLQLQLTGCGRTSCCERSRKFQQGKRKYGRADGPERGDSGNSEY